MTAVQILLAYAADLCFGDPQWLPHPVRIVGFISAFAEKLCRRIASAPSAMLAIGSVVALVIPAGAAVAAWFVVKEIFRVSPWAAWGATVAIAYTTLSVRSLDQAAQDVINHLRRAEITGARNALAMIVGRDTQALDESEMVRATIETVAENTSDGVVAPLFYMMIGGVPAAVAYKAINTLDSMFGYKNERYLYFGRASARLDDVVNYLPARLTAVLVALGALLLGLSWKGSIRIVLRDARSQPSPNAGFPEAAYAGALGIRLGGNNSYGSHMVQKAFIGDASRGLTISLQPETRRLLYMTSLLAVGVSVAGVSVIRWIRCI